MGNLTIFKILAISGRMSLSIQHLWAYNPRPGLSPQVDPGHTLLLPASPVLQSHGCPRPGLLPRLGAGAEGGGDWRHGKASWGAAQGCPRSLPTPTGCPHPPLTFSSASLSGLPCVNARTGSLATVREGVCLHRSLGCKGRGQRQTGQWWPLPDPAPRPPTAGRGILGWPRIPKSRASTEPGEGGRTGPGVQNPSSRPGPASVCPWARDPPPPGRSPHPLRTTIQTHTAV